MRRRPDFGGPLLGARRTWRAARRFGSRFGNPQSKPSYRACESVTEDLGLAIGGSYRQPLPLPHPACRGLMQISSPYLEQRLPSRYEAKKIARTLAPKILASISKPP